MGYYTSYELTVDKDGDKIHEEFISISNNFKWALEYAGEGSNRWYPNDSAKWYDHDIDMCALSKEYPDILFTLTGNGEDTGDIWRSWYRNGEKISEWTLDYNIPNDPDWNKK